MASGGIGGLTRLEGPEASRGAWSGKRWWIRLPTKRGFSCTLDSDGQPADGQPGFSSPPPFRRRDPPKPTPTLLASASARFWQKAQFHAWRDSGSAWGYADKKPSRM